LNKGTVHFGQYNLSMGGSLTSFIYPNTEKVYRKIVLLKLLDGG